ncbi:hypothetical protein GQ42DRAFT_158177 [Ramicandelaber brevisporus]|nr:hypothetical protein GQ42DRAFT_158177 [Ramicandelaber brevisporus]
MPPYFDGHNLVVSDDDDDDDVASSSYDSSGTDLESDYSLLDSPEPSSLFSSPGSSNTAYDVLPEIRQVTCLCGAQLSSCHCLDQVNSIAATTTTTTATITSAPTTDSRPLLKTACDTAIARFGKLQQLLATFRTSSTQPAAAAPSTSLRVSPTAEARPTRLRRAFSEVIPVASSSNDMRLSQPAESPLAHPRQTPLMFSPQRTFSAMLYSMPVMASPSIPEPKAISVLGSTPPLSESSDTSVQAIVAAAAAAAAAATAMATATNPTVVPSSSLPALSNAKFAEPDLPFEMATRTSSIMMSLSVSNSSEPVLSRKSSQVQHVPPVQLSSSLTAVAAAAADSPSRHGHRHRVSHRALRRQIKTLNQQLEFQRTYITMLTNDLHNKEESLNTYRVMLQDKFTKGQDLEHVLLLRDQENAELHDRVSQLEEQLESTRADLFIVRAGGGGNVGGGKSSGIRGVVDEDDYRTSVENGFWGDIMRGTRSDDGFSGSDFDESDSFDEDTHSDSDADSDIDDDDINENVENNATDGAAPACPVSTHPDLICGDAFPHEFDLAASSDDDQSSPEPIIESIEEEEEEEEDAENEADADDDNASVSSYGSDTPPFSKIVREAFAQYMVSRPSPAKIKRLMDDLVFEHDASQTELLSALVSVFVNWCDSNVLLSTPSSSPATSPGTTVGVRPALPIERVRVSPTELMKVQFEQQWQPIFLNYLLNDDDQAHVLDSLEIAFSASYFHLLPLHVHILKTFYEHDLLTDDSIICWWQSPSHGLGSEQLRSKSERLVGFLLSVSESDNEDDAEDDSSCFEGSFSDVSPAIRARHAAAVDEDEEEDDDDDVPNLCFADIILQNPPPVVAFPTAPMPDSEGKPSPHGSPRTIRFAQVTSLVDSDGTLSTGRLL